jgi:hypothetical protein
MSGVRLSSRPVSSRPVSGHLVPSSGIRLSGRLVSARPAAGRLVSTGPSGHIRLVRGSPGGGLGDQVGAAGNLHDRDGSSCTWSAVSRAARSTARVGLEGGDPAEVVRRRAGERQSRTWPGRARAQAAAALDR